MAVATYTKTGTKATSAAKLDKNVFGVVVSNHELLKSAYVAYQANGRQNLARTKTRGLVSGGGKKPWKQKGTGRARFGSSRNPIWRGGGIAFGPTGNENYRDKLNVKSKRRAITQALSVAADADKIKIIEALVSSEGKTKDMVKFLSKIEATGTILCVVSQKDTAEERSIQNIAKAKIVSAKYLNVFDILNADTIIITQKALTIISEWLVPNMKATAKPTEGGAL